jgi:hypothetical protein
MVAKYIPGDLCTTASRVSACIAPAHRLVLATVVNIFTPFLGQVESDGDPRWGREYGHPGPPLSIARFRR